MAYKDGPLGLLRVRHAVPMLVAMSHAELLPAICAAIAVELAHLRWVLLTQWKCRTCTESHLNCDCKPVWVKLLL
ncbi:MAG: hypothetical protein QOH16_1045 [Gaiellaceae bacterium]|jgi:hypothetical protein|nr:hypothetical protein [Gaiellaceae bacterium]